MKSRGNVWKFAYRACLTRSHQLSPDHDVQAPIGTSRQQHFDFSGEAIKARPAVVKAYEWTPKINPGAGGIRTAEERAILFGQTAQSVASMAGTKQ